MIMRTKVKRMKMIITKNKIDNLEQYFLCSLFNIGEDDGDEK